MKPRFLSTSLALTMILGSITAPLKAEYYYDEGNDNNSLEIALGLLAGYAIYEAVHDDKHDYAKKVHYPHKRHHHHRPHYKKHRYYRDHYSRDHYPKHHHKRYHKYDRRHYNRYGHKHGHWKHKYHHGHKPHGYSKHKHHGKDKYYEGRPYIDKRELRKKDRHHSHFKHERKHTHKKFKHEHGEKRATHIRSKWLES